jgi:ribonuclease HI
MNGIWLFTDGAARANGKSHCKSSWGFIVVEVCKEQPNVLHQCMGLVKKDQSNNRGELSAILYGLKWVCDNCLGKHVTVVTDSKYSIDCIETWAPNWIVKGLQDKKNTDLIYPIVDLVAQMRINNNILFIHVRSHTKKPIGEPIDMLKWEYNMLVDKLCTSVLDDTVL